MPTQRKIYQPHRFSRGVSLIEVMIAVLIMGVGLLGIAAMQATALRNNESALERTQATIQTYSILDAMRANRDNALGGAYNLARTCTTPAGNTTLAENDLRRWIGSLKDTLGNNDGSCGTVACNGAECVITVEWDDSRATEGSTATAAVAGNAARQVITRARL